MGRNGLAASVENKFMSPRRRRGEKKLKIEMEGGKTRADTLTLNSPRWKKIFAPPPLHSSCSSSGFAATRTCQTQYYPSFLLSQAKEGGGILQQQQQQINSRVFLAFFHSYMGAGNPTTGHWRRRLAPMSPTTRTTLSRARGGPGI